MDCDNLNRDELMKLIMENKFAINDMALYLDTHPCDQRALRIHNEYSRKLAELKEMYQEQYGPLTIYYPTGNSWQWIEGPWPWERGGV